MSVKIAKDFMKKLTENPALVKALKDAPHDDARRTIAKDAGFHFEKAHIDKALEEAKIELSDEELDIVAGGNTEGWVGVGVGAASVAAAA